MTNKENIFFRIKSSIFKIKEINTLGFVKPHDLDCRYQYLAKNKLTIPIPNIFEIKRHTKRDISILVLIGEFLQITRPLIHCFTLLIKSSRSYTPYLTNIFIDTLWLILVLISKGTLIFKTNFIQKRI